MMSYFTFPLPPLCLSLLFSVWQWHWKVYPCHVKGWNCPRAVGECCMGHWTGACAATRVVVGWGGDFAAWWTLEVARLGWFSWSQKHLKLLLYYFYISCNEDADWAVSWDVALIKSTYYELCSLIVVILCVQTVQEANCRDSAIAYKVNGNVWFNENLPGTVWMTQWSVSTSVSTGAKMSHFSRCFRSLFHMRTEKRGKRRKTGGKICLAFCLNTPLEKQEATTTVDVSKKHWHALAISNR